METSEMQTNSDRRVDGRKTIRLIGPLVIYVVHGFEESEAPHVCQL